MRIKIISILNGLLFKIILIIISSQNISFSQSREIDSLNSIKPKSSIEKINLLIALSKAYVKYNADSCVKFAERALPAAKKINNHLIYGRALATMARALTFKGGQQKRVFSLLRQAIDELEKTKDKSALGKAYNLLAMQYDYAGKYNVALNYYLKSLKYLEEANDRNELINANGNLAIIYDILGDTSRALKYQLKSLSISIELGDKESIALNYSNLGSHFDEFDTDKALNFHLMAFKIRNELKDSIGIANSLNNISALYYLKGKREKAIETLREAINIKEHLRSEQRIGSAYYNMGYMLEKDKKYNESIGYYKKSLYLAEQFSDVYKKINCLLGIMVAYDSLHEYKSSLQFANLYINLIDSVYSAEENKQALEMKEKYETEKKEGELKLEKAKYQQKDAQSKLKNLYLYGAVVVLVIVLILLWNVNRHYSQKKIANKQLELKNAEIISQKNIIEEKHKEISDSINYAQRIQTALLTSDEYWKEISDDYFVLLKPKDIVSGDFFWAFQTDDENPIAVWCAADCTGHGVPGAFMSMLGIGFLNEIVVENKIIKADEILNHLRDKIIKSLEYKVGHVQQRDGMDIALCVWNKSTNHFQYAGANNPLWIARKDEIGNYSIIELSPNKMPVGRFTESQQPFKSHTLQLQKGDVIYAFSDGFPDQFGGEKGKKFKYSTFQKIILSHASKPLVDQKKIYSNAFEEWKGSYEQTDDVCVIGIKI